MAIDPNDYKGREQAYVKHVVLDSYLKELAFKLGHASQRGLTFNYIDGFSGPWNTQGPNDRDSSPHIALSVLEAVEKQMFAAKKPLVPRAMFVEENKKAHGALKLKCASFPNIHTETHHARFEDRITEAVEFAATGKDSFGFVFIDPTGWKGYGLKAITPLLQVKRSEFLVNFMTKDIIRFVDHRAPSLLPTFIDLYGDESYSDEWAELEGLDREDQIVETYCERLRIAGNFKHVVSAVVLNPIAKRTHYHLIYATRSDVGLITFREVEARGLKAQRTVRAEAKKRARCGFRGK